jgi:hypothetical protein
MKEERIYSNLEEIVYQFDEKDIEMALKSTLNDAHPFDNCFRILYSECGEFKGAEIRVLYRKENK